MNRAACWVSMVLTAFAVTSCGSRTLEKSASEVFPADFHHIRERILVPRCVTCHAKIVSHKALLGDLVVAGSPDTSPLFDEINSGGMPKYGNKLSDEEIDAVKTWITQGAPND